MSYTDLSKSPNQARGLLPGRQGGGSPGSGRLGCHLRSQRGDGGSRRDRPRLTRSAWAPARGGAEGMELPSWMSRRLCPATTSLWLGAVREPSRARTQTAAPCASGRLRDSPQVWGLTKCFKNTRLNVEFFQKRTPSSECK